MAAPPPTDHTETRVVPPDGPGGPEPEPSRGLGWGMLLGALVVIAVAGAAVAIYFATRDEGSGAAAGPATTATTAATSTRLLPATQVFVPDVTGMRQDEAASRLGDVGLAPAIRLRPTKKPTGKVVEQKPRAGKRAKRGSKVTLVVDRGAPAVSVPDVTGLTAADARSKLAAAGLEVQTTQVTSTDRPARTVVSQAPAAGKKLQKGAAVTLSIARAAPATASTTTAAATTSPSPTTTAPARTTTAPAQPTTATVPDLGGEDVQAASQALAAANLKATLQYVPGDDPLGTVTAQRPAAGGTAPARSHVTVNASSGPNAQQQATVPDAVGQTLDQAVSTLNGAGLRLIFVKTPVTTRASVGKIVEQTPAAGKSAPKNAQVLVYLGVTG